MTGSAPTGNGPLEFTDSGGKLVSIPLTALSFDASGKLVVNLAWRAVLSAPPADALLKYAQAQGIIAPAPVPSPKPAAIIRAASPGLAGNNIVISISNVTANPDPTKTTFDIGVTETETYKGLTSDNIESILGTASTSGSQPGLVRVVSPVKDTKGLPDVSQVTLSKGTTVSRSSWLVADKSKTPIFTLEARDPGVNGDSIAVSFSVVSAPPFDLTVTLTQKSLNMTVASFQSSVVKDLGYEIIAAAPSGGVFSVPAAGSTNLSGGSAAISASAILVAGQ